MLTLAFVRNDFEVAVVSSVKEETLEQIFDPKTAERIRELNFETFSESPTTTVHISRAPIEEIILLFVLMNPTIRINLVSESQMIQLMDKAKEIAAIERMKNNGGTIH